MRYAYYPGCSLEATAKPYQESVASVAKTLGIELVELNDWNCCGATAYMSVNEVLSFCLSARNLSQAPRDRRCSCHSLQRLLHQPAQNRKVSGIVPGCAEEGRHGALRSGDEVRRRGRHQALPSGCGRRCGPRSREIPSETSSEGIACRAVLRLSDREALRD